MAPYQARVELWFSDSLREFALTKTEQLGDLLDRASMLPRFDRLSFAPRLEALRNWIEATSSNDEVAPGIPVLWSLETEMVGRAWEALIVEQGHERREKAKAALSDILRHNGGRGAPVRHALASDEPTSG